MLVEFLGVPGSGKSTISHVVADTLRSRMISVAEITYELERNYQGTIPRLLLKTFGFSNYVLKHPLSSFLLCRFIASTNQQTLLDLAKSLFNWIFIASVVDARRGSVVTILDQGVAQAMWSVGFAAQRETWADLLSHNRASVEKMPDLVVHVRAGVQSVGERLANRAQRGSRLDSHGRNYPSLVRARTNSNAIVRILRDKGVQVIEIDNDYPEQLTLGARAIADVLMAKLAQNYRTPNPQTTLTRSPATAARVTKGQR